MQTKNWLKVAIIAALPTLASAHTLSPYILPEVFDTPNSSSVTFQSAITIEKFFVPGINFKSNYIVTSPNGQNQEVNAAAALKRFSIAETDLNQEGTYRIRTNNAIGNSGKYALVDGRWLRVRGARPAQAPRPQEADKPKETAVAKPAQPPRMITEDKLPKDAQIFEVKNHLIAETYITKGKPSPIPAISKKGFEFSLASHPNELFVGESLKAQILVDGKPVPNLEVEVFKGASSFEPSAKREMPSIKTNAKGEVAIKFEQPGIYLITTSYPEAEKDNTKKPASDIYTYGLTVEITE